MTFGFFQDDCGNYSMSRLLLFGAFCVSSCIAIWLHTQDALNAVLTAWVVNYSAAKLGETAKYFKTPTQGDTP